MIRNLGIFALFICGVVTITGHRGGHAQTGILSVDLSRCDSWTPVGWDKKGTRRSLFAISFGKPNERTQVEGSFVANNRLLTGLFVTPGQLLVSIISEPNKQAPTDQFVTLAGSPIEFHPHGANYSIKVRNGRLPPLRLPPELIPIDCVKGESPIALEEAADGKKLTDLLDKTPGLNPGSLSGKFSEDKKPKSLVEDLRKERVTPVDKEPKAPSAKSELTAGLVCSADKFQRVPVAADMTLKSPLTVGFRNIRTEAKGFDYLSIGGDAIPLDINFDVADSKGKLVSYEAVVGSRDDLLVSLTGVDETRAKAKGRVASKLLRVVIVGGAPEVAISGLALVETEIKKQSQGGIRIDAEWHIVDASGSLSSSGRYESLEKLVKAAAEKAAGRASDLLNETQLINLLNGFERVLNARRQPAEKIFWIKGAYPIPSSIPPRFEKFIANISDGTAVAHTPAGRSAKWFVLVSARTSGFSINYLKEPIYAQQIGDVIEEDPDILATRRLIGDVPLLATRLQIASVPMPAGEEKSAFSVITGRLVLKGSDIFNSRGYLLSQETITALRDHLDLVTAHWSATALSQEDLQFWASKTRKSAPTIVDILQNVDERNSPRLPKLPDWASKPIRDLNPSEVRDARFFIHAYVNGANKVARDIFKTSEKKDDPDCGLFYVPEEVFGFGRH